MSEWPSSVGREFAGELQRSRVTTCRVPAGPRSGTVFPLPVDALAALQAIVWPGNVRELRTFLINLSVVADRRPVTAAMVRALVRERRGMASERVPHAFQ